MIFVVLKECRKPSLKDFIRPSSCLSSEWLHSLPFDFLRVWLFARGMEFFFNNGRKEIWGDISAKSEMALQSINRTKVSRMECETIEVETCSVDEILDDIKIPKVTEQFNQSTSCNDDVGTSVHDLPEKEQYIFERLRQTLSSSSNELRIPSLSATKSVLSAEIGENQLTNIFTIPLIPGPASDFIAIYSALICVQGISIWSCGTTCKTTISLDLDLYQKAYLLINTREDMRNMFVLRLGELHTEFAMIRAIGLYISGSGIDMARLKAR